MFQTDNSYGNNSSGTGLGLYISNILAQKLGNSKISVDSTLNIGSVFSFLVESSEIPHSALSVYLSDS